MNLFSNFLSLNSIINHDIHAWWFSTSIAHGHSAFSSRLINSVWIHLRNLVLPKNKFLSFQDLSRKWTSTWFHISFEKKWEKLGIIFKGMCFKRWSNKSCVIFPIFTGLYQIHPVMSTNITLWIKVACQWLLPWTLVWPHFERTLSHILPGLSLGPN